MVNNRTRQQIRVVVVAVAVVVAVVVVVVATVWFGELNCFDGPILSGGQNDTIRKEGYLVVGISALVAIRKHRPFLTKQPFSLNDRRGLLSDTKLCLGAPHGLSRTTNRSEILPLGRHLVIHVVVVFACR